MALLVASTPPVLSCTADLAWVAYPPDDSLVASVVADTPSEVPSEGATDEAGDSILTVFVEFVLCRL